MMTVNQIASTLEVYPSTVRRWCEAGQHPQGWGIWAEKIGRDWHVAAALCWCGRVVWLAPTSQPGEFSGCCAMCGNTHRERHEITGGKSQ